MYHFVYNNPVNLLDVDGRRAKPASDPAMKGKLDKVKEACGGSQKLPQGDKGACCQAIKDMFVDALGVNDGFIANLFNLGAGAGAQACNNACACDPQPKTGQNFCVIFQVA